MKYKLLVLLCFLAFLTLSPIQAKAIDDYEIRYYFKDDSEYVLNEEIDIFYHPLYDDDYPVFPGYDFVKVDIEDKVYKLYYQIQYHNIIIKGNGGLTANNEEEVVVAKIKHGSVFTFNIVNYRDLFSYPGYELIKYSRPFDNKVTVYEDIIINCVWQSQVNYKFIIGNKEYYLRQILGNKMIIPNIVYHENFVGWFDENNNIISDDYLVDNDVEKTIYGKYLTDFITINSQEIRINKHQIFNYPHLFNGDIEQVLTENDGQYIFSQLQANTTYQLIIEVNGQQTMIYLNIRNKELFFTLDDRIIYDPNYQYFVDDMEVLPFNGLINNYENLIIKQNNERLVDYTIINLLPSNYLESSISSHAIKVKLDNIIEYYLFDQCNHIEEQDSLVIFHQLLPNKTYYFVYRLTDDENYYVSTFNTLNFDIEIFGNQIVIHNAKGYQISYLDDLYLPNQNDKIVIPNLAINQEYEMTINHNGFSYQVTFKTNNLISEFETNIQYEVGEDYIHLYDLPSDYKYYLSSEVFNPIDNSLSIYNLKPNTVYELYCTPLNSDSRYRILFLTFTTKKIPSEKVSLPDKKVEMISVEEKQITIKNNLLYEYSLDKINWISTNDEILIISRLQSYHNYYLYVRTKATSDKEASTPVLVNVFKTLAEVPSLDCFVDLYYTDRFLSFKMKDGYNYYFNNQLITIKDYFEIDNLDSVQKCHLKVERISDLATFTKDITLRVLTKLTDEEKKITFQKTYSSLTIVSSNPNLRYILYNADNVAIQLHGDGNDINFQGLIENNVYKLYVIKDFDDISFYEEEYIMDIYIPRNINEIVDDFLTSISRKRNKKVNEIIEKYAEEITKINSEKEFNIIVKKLQDEILKLYDHTGLYLAIFGILLLFFGGFITYLMKKKSKK